MPVTIAQCLLLRSLVAGAKRLAAERPARLLAAALALLLALAIILTTNGASNNLLLYWCGAGRGYEAGASLHLHHQGGCSAVALDTQL